MHDEVTAQMAHGIMHRILGRPPANSIGMLLMGPEVGEVGDGQGSF